MTSHINAAQLSTAKEEPKPELPFGCEYCKKRFDNSKELGAHLALHPEVREKVMMN